VQTQLCEFCLRSGMLCSKCQEKVRSGEVNDLYMGVAQFLLDIESQYPSLQKARLNKVAEAGGYLVLVVGRGDRARFIDSTGKLTRDLGDKFGKRVLVIEEGVNDRGFLEDLFANQHIVTINIIWLPDGSTETRVVLRSRGSRRLSKKRIRALTNIAKKVRNMDLRVEYSY
jgi:transcription antitermination factor NusA-like protein